MTSQPSLLVKLLTPLATLPHRATPGSAGYDLFAAEDKVITAQNKQVVKTDVSIAIPSGHYGRVAPRSGLTVKHFIDIGAGVIDSDYRGPIDVVMFNFSTNDYKVKTGDKIAQLVLEKIITPEVVEVDSLDETQRGEGGFGSTGN